MNKKPPLTSRPIYGVNLGGWLVLERWITPSLFKGVQALDEYTFHKLAGKQNQSQLQRHFETFITKDDFVWLASQGITAIRLPVGYGLFGDQEPYPKTIEYIDRAFTWAEELGISILLDLHTAPGSQNGWQESGRIGEVLWHTDPQNIRITLDVIRRLADRYKNQANLLGIELLNEPHSKIPRKILLRYYEAAYKIIREVCGEKVWVVFSDNFKPRRWKRKLRGPSYINTYIDTHQYQTYRMLDKRRNIAGHVRKSLGAVRRRLNRMRKYHPVIVGEWSLALHARSLQGLNDTQMTAARRAFAAAQLISYEQTSAWFYWTYKTEDAGPWNFRKSMEKGWLQPLDHTLYKK